MLRFLIVHCIGLGPTCGPAGPACLARAWAVLFSFLSFFFFSFLFLSFSSFSSFFFSLSFSFPFFLFFFFFSLLASAQVALPKLLSVFSFHLLFFSLSF